MNRPTRCNWTGGSHSGKTKIHELKVNFITGTETCSRREAKSGREGKGTASSRTGEQQNTN
jgi:hypothetical protein